jgi:hypothetical protein
MIALETEAGHLHKPLMVRSLIKNELQTSLEEMGDPIEKDKKCL